MRIDWGTSRFVVLIGPVALKFARFRLTWIIVRFCQHLKRGQVGSKLHHQAKNPQLATNNIFVGLLANKREYALWLESPQTSLMPTWWSFAGLVNIQPRGRRVTSSELLAEHPLEHLVASMPRDLVGDMFKRANFARYHGKIVLVDYGSQETVEFLAQPVTHAAPVLA